MAGTPAQRGYNAAGNTDSSRRTTYLALGVTSSFCLAPMGRPGQLNPDGRDSYVRYDPPIDHWKLRSAAEQERLQQVREVEGEAAHQDRRRAWEKASQPLVTSWFLPKLPDHTMDGGAFRFAGRHDDRHQQEDDCCGRKTIRRSAPGTYLWWRDR